MKQISPPSQSTKQPAQSVETLLEYIFGKQRLSPTEQARTKDYLWEAVGRLTGILLRQNRLLATHAPDIIMEHEAEILRNRMASVSLLSKAVGISPNGALKAYVRSSLQSMQNGEFGGVTYASFSKEDESGLKALLEKELVFPPPPPNWLDEARRVIMPSKLDKQIYFNKADRTDGRPRIIKPGEWFALKKDDLRDYFYDLTEEVRMFPRIEIPLLSAKNVSIHVSFAGQIQAFERVDEPNPDFPSTYPPTNPFFGRSSIKSHRGSVYHFKANYTDPSSFLGHYGGASEYAQLTSQSQEARRATHVPLSPSTHKQIHRILGHQLQKAGFVQDTLERLVSFVHEHSSGEEVGDDTQQSLPRLLTRYEKEGQFPGDCKSHSTITLGFSTYLGFTGRRIEGIVQCPDGVVGHVWPELYIPQTRSWIPVDSATNLFKAYPDSDGMYVAFANLPRFESGKGAVRMKINYE